MIIFLKDFIFEVKTSKINYILINNNNMIDIFSVTIYI